MHVVGAEDTQLRRVMASKDTHDRHDVAFDHAFNSRNTIDVETIAILHDGRIATGVDGTDNGFLNL